MQKTIIQSHVNCAHQFEMLCYLDSESIQNYVLWRWFLAQTVIWSLIIWGCFNFWSEWDRLLLCYRWRQAARMRVTFKVLEWTWCQAMYNTEARSHKVFFSKLRRGRERESVSQSVDKARPYASAWVTYVRSEDHGAPLMWGQGLQEGHRMTTTAMELGNDIIWWLSALSIARSRSSIMFRRLE